jgi:hypothetical protein
MTGEMKNPELRRRLQAIATLLAKSSTKSQGFSASGHQTMN